MALSPCKYVVDDEGWLRGPRVLHLPSPMHYARLASGEPLGVMWHFTGGRATPGHALALARMIQRKGKRDASWHIVISREGSVIQSVSCLAGAWHCAEGKVSHKGIEYTPNRSLIGIELENAGELRRHHGLFFRWSPKWVHLGDLEYQIATPRVASCRDKYWDDFPAEQVQAARDVILALVERYQMSPGHLSHGHRDFDPSRRPDPGDLWVDQYLPSVLEGIGGGDVVG